MITHRLDPLKRKARFDRVAAANRYALLAMRVGRLSTLGMAYSAAVIGLENLRKLSHLTGAQKEAWAQRIKLRVRQHEDKVLEETEVSLAANVAIDRHVAELKRIRSEA